MKSRQPFFCGLENNLSAQKYISTLLVNDINGEGWYIHDQKLIEKLIRRYYKELNENKDEFLEIHVNDFLEENIPQPKLNHSQIEMLEQEITLEELAKALKKSKNESTPGSSGFTYAFYKCFWKIMGGIIYRAVSFSFTIGKLPSSQAVEIISLLPKRNKPKHLLENWRPITLQNSVYKLLSAALANRLNLVLPSIINKDQSGFVNGR